MKNTRRLLWFAPLPFLLAACNGECYDNRNALPLATFRTGNQTVSLADSVRVYGMGVPNDSAIWDGATSATQIYLPFQVDRDTTCYIFDDLRSGVTDTVRFCYTRTPVFASYDCGVSYVYDIRNISCSGLLIDSVTCPEGKITNSLLSNLIIYLRNGD